MADHQFLDRVTIRRWREVGLITHEEAAHLLTVNQTGDPGQVTGSGSSGEPYADPAPGFTLTEIMKHNIAKLQKRYPQGFSTERSRNRTI